MPRRHDAACPTHRQPVCAAPVCSDPPHASFHSCSALCCSPCARRSRMELLPRHHIRKPAPNLESPPARASFGATPPIWKVLESMGGLLRIDFKGIAR